MSSLIHLSVILELEINKELLIFNAKSFEKMGAKPMVDWSWLCFNPRRLAGAYLSLGWL